MSEHTHHSPDDQYLETPPGAGYEHTDADVGAMVKFGFWLGISIVAVMVGIAGSYVFMKRMSAQDPQTKAYPLSDDTQFRLPPEPRLQQSPANDVYEFKLEQGKALTEYGWKDKAAGVVHIPIADAMKLTLERGLPSRETQASATPPASSLMPSDASAGRVMERRRQ